MAANSTIWIGVEAAADEHDDVSGGGVEPMEIIDRHQQRLAGRLRREQPQHPEPDEEQIASFVVLDAERGEKHGTLRTGELVEAPEKRAQQPMQPRIRQVGLDLGAGRRQDTEPLHRCLGAGSVEQGRLADPGLAAKNERAPLVAHLI